LILTFRFWIYSSWWM